MNRKVKKMNNISLCNSGKCMVLFFIMVFSAFRVLPAQDDLPIFLQKDVLSWKIIDEGMSTKFLSAYTEYDYKSGIQTDNTMTVYMKPKNGKFILYQLDAYDPEDKAMKKLNMDIIKTDMNPALVEELIARKYNWDDLNYQYELDKVQGVSGKGPKNIFPAKNHKTAQDLFWWAYRAMNLNIANSMIVRLKNYPLGITFETGDADVGFPANFSHSIGIGICNELVKGQLIVPMKPFIKIDGYRPIEGGYGVGLKFDSHMFGGSIVYKNPNWMNISDNYFSDTCNVVLTNWYAIGTYGISLGIPKIKYLGATTARIKFGLGFHQIQYGGVNVKENSFELFDQTNAYESFIVIIKYEWLSNLDKNYNDMNKWKSSSQLTWNPNGHVGFYSYFSYAFTPLFRIGMYMGYNKPMEFEKKNITNGITEKHIWKPGFMIAPEISLIIG